MFFQEEKCFEKCTHSPHCKPGDKKGCDGADYLRCMKKCGGSEVITYKLKQEKKLPGSTSENKVLSRKANFRNNRTIFEDKDKNSSSGRQHSTYQSVDRSNIKSNVVNRVTHHSSDTPVNPIYNQTEKFNDYNLNFTFENNDKHLDNFDFTKNKRLQPDFLEELPNILVDDDFSAKTGHDLEKGSNFLQEFSSINDVDDGGKIKNHHDQRIDSDIHSRYKRNDFLHFDPDDLFHDDFMTDKLNEDDEYDDPFEENFFENVGI